MSEKEPPEAAAGRARERISYSYLLSFSDLQFHFVFLGNLYLPELPSLPGRSAQKDGEVPHSARRATTGWSPLALTAGYMPKMTPSATEKRKAPRVMMGLGSSTSVVVDSSSFPATMVPT